MSKKPNRKRAFRIDLHVTEDELRVIKLKAKQAGFSVSEYVRRACKGQKISPAPTEEERQIVWEIRKIGNNLNQIAKKFNALGIPPDSELGDCISDVSQMKMLLEQKLILRRGEVDGSDIDLGNRLPDG